MHTSGRHGLEVLAPAAALGARTVAVHPAMTFTGTSVDLDRLAGCVFGLTAGPEERAFAEALVADLGGSPMWVPEEMRTLYHAGLAHGANHLVTLVTEAMEMLRAAGSEDPAGTLRPLLTAALDNALADGDAALTGPIVRGDAETVRLHLADLEANAPQTLPSYLALARATLGRVVTDGRVQPIRALKIKQLLDEAAPPVVEPRSRQARPTDLPSDPRRRPHPRRAGRRAGSRARVLVPTMGALHEGHASLMRTARASTDGPVVVSIFVNPLQFGAGEDLDRYPRTLDDDLKLCEREGVDVVFVPTVAEVYPQGVSTSSTNERVSVDPGPLGDVLEGRTRPGHFRGVLTVVAKLFGLVRPDIAVFGEKDYQQLVLIRRMVSDLCLGVEIVGAETEREPDGLALSSRNRFLDDEQRQQAVTLSRTLRAAQQASAHGVDAALDAARDELRTIRRRRPRLPRDHRPRPRTGRPRRREAGSSSPPGSAPPA